LKSSCDQALLEEHMPFLFKLLYNKMNNRSKEEVDDNADNSEPEKSDAGGKDSEDECMFNGKTVKDPKSKPSSNHPQRARMVYLINSCLTMTNHPSF
jgi:hypothetical protein